MIHASIGSVKGIIVHHETHEVTVEWGAILWELKGIINLAF